MDILAIESSCDETAAALVRDGRTVLSSAVASSSALHERYGGIVPEIAAREQLAYLYPVIREALRGVGNIPVADAMSSSVDAIAVSAGPGLIGSLLIGVEGAKTLSFVTGKPLIPVNHVLAHMYANFLDGPQHVPVSFPAISLVVSGGHTELFLMKNERSLAWLGGTLDDAAGEAFDKSARLLGFGSRGGVAIQESASTIRDPRTAHAILRLPRPMMHDDTLNFSFSGLKTAISREWAKHDHTPEVTAAFAFEIQDAVTDVLVAKTLTAASMHNAQSVLVSGGVAANTMLRVKFSEKLSDPEWGGVTLHIPEVRFCTDNAAYIGSYAFFRGTAGSWRDVNAVPDMSVEVTG